MKTGIWKIILISCFFSTMPAGIGYWLISSNNKKIGVVDAVKLFDQYNMKKELEAREKQKLQGISMQMDSVDNMLSLAKATKNVEEIKRLSYTSAYLKVTLDKAYEAGNKDINEQIWKRLNPAIEQYGKQKGLHLIIGANGMGTVLYNDAYYDLTDDAIKYVNKKYEDGN